MRRRKKMVVIADSPMHITGGKSYGFGPVVREFEFLLQEFDEITWMGFIWPNDDGNPIYDEIKNPRLKLEPIKLIGGQSIKQKLEVLVNTPRMIVKIFRLVLSADIVHTRGPSSPAFLACLLSLVFRRKIWWNKYAGNWMQENPPAFYALQKKLLLKLKHTKVTINGYWNKQPQHCISFENPCLYDDDLILGLTVAAQKSFHGDISCLFVGRLEEEKGVQRIIDSFKGLNTNRIITLHFVGNGRNRTNFEAQAKELSFKTYFHGFLSHAAVHALFKEAHFLLLPSMASEGFPKVIAEAACYGCIPVVSDISSITHYVKHQQNGFVWEIKGTKSYGEVLLETLSQPAERLSQIAMAGNDMATQFGFSAFLKKLKITLALDD